MKTYLRFSIVLLVLALLAGCESDQVAGSDSVAFSKASKKCASASIAFLGIGTWYPVLVDTTTIPPDTLVTFDAGLIYSMARRCDALYMTNNYGDLLLFDISDPRNPAQPQWGVNLGNRKRYGDLRASGANLYVGWELCDGNDGYYENCTHGTDKWNISDPFSPRLIWTRQDP